MDDDFELEVTDLRTGQPVRMHRFVQPAAPSSADAAPDTVSDGSDTDNAPFAPARSRKRQRATGGALTAGVVLLIVALLAALPNSRASFSALLRVATPTPTAPLPAFANSFYAVNTVPWGKLTADGRGISNLVLNNSQPLPFILSRGHHTIQYQAAPFKPLRCTVDVPSAGKDTCTEISGNADQYQLQLQGKQRALDLGASVDNLSSDARASLLRATEDALGAMTLTIQLAPGDHYLAADRSIAVATEATQAQQIDTLNLDPNRPMPQNGPSQSCETICSAGYYASGDSWSLFAHGILTWVYTPQDGQTFNAPALDQGLPDVILPLTANWISGAWHVDAQPYSITGQCELAFNLGFQRISEAMAPPSNVGGSSGISIIGNSGAMPDTTGGCLIGATTVQDGATPDTGNPIYLLYRAGVLLPVSPRARDLFPDLPAPSANETALANHLISEQQG